METKKTTSGRRRKGSAGDSKHFSIDGGETDNKRGSVEEEACRGEKQTERGQEGGKSRLSVVQETLANLNFHSYSSDTMLLILCAHRATITPKKPY